MSLEVLFQDICWPLAAMQTNRGSEPTVIMSQITRCIPIKEAFATTDSGEPYTGALLRMATDVANRMMPVFDTVTEFPWYRKLEMRCA